MRVHYPKIELAIPHLQIGDLVLIKGKQRYVSRLISHVTKSYWSHVAMVFDLPQLDANTQDVSLIESLDNGIEIHRLAWYLRRRKEYAIGIKRMVGLTYEERERIRGFFLDAVDTPYDYSRVFALFVSPYLLKIAGAPFVRGITKKWINVNQYICTSFVQRAFYLGVSPDKRHKVFFRQDESVDFLDKMEVISPGDIARSKNTEWIFNEHA